MRKREEWITQDIWIENIHATPMSLYSFNRKVFSLIRQLDERMSMHKACIHCHSIHRYIRFYFSFFFYTSLYLFVSYAHNNNNNNNYKWQSAFRYLLLYNFNEKYFSCVFISLFVLAVDRVFVMLQQRGEIFNSTSICIILYG